MLGYVIPLRPRSLSKNWEKDRLLLKRTLSSLLDQKDSEFNIFVVYTDDPSLKLNDPRVSFIHFPLPYLTQSQISDYDSYGLEYHGVEAIERNMDKGRKINYGCIAAKLRGCTYIMQVDADDLISNKIAKFVNSNFYEPGWFINKGYIYNEGKKYLLKQPCNMHFLNGSTHIIRQDLVPVTDLSNTNLYDYSFFVSHGYLVKRMLEFYGETLKPIPFYANIYIISGNNQSNIEALSNNLSFKNIGKLILRSKVLTKSIKDEFGLYKLEKINM